MNKLQQKTWESGNGKMEESGFSKATDTLFVLKAFIRWIIWYYMRVLHTYKHWDSHASNLMHDLLRSQSHTHTRTQHVQGRAPGDRFSSTRHTKIEKRMKTHDGNKSDEQASSSRPISSALSTPTSRDGRCVCIYACIRETRKYWFMEIKQARNWTVNSCLLFTSSKLQQKQQ